MRPEAGSNSLNSPSPATLTFTLYLLLAAQHAPLPLNTLPFGTFHPYTLPKSVAGFELGISCSVGRRSIHWAVGTYDHAKCNLRISSERDLVSSMFFLLRHGTQFCLHQSTQFFITVLNSVFIIVFSSSSQYSILSSSLHSALHHGTQFTSVLFTESIH
jgi:hypothetical protein